jgi:PAS domain S-box-containing protein
MLTVMECANELPVVAPTSAIAASEPDAVLQALHASSTIVVTYDLTGRLTWVLGASQVLLGWNNDEMVGRAFTDFLHPSEHPRLWRRLASRAQGDRVVLQRELLFLHRLGHAVPLLITVGPHIRGDQVVGGAGAVTDDSAIRRMRAERDAALAARSRAEGAVRTGRSVVHELASPLGAVLGIAELLAADDRTPPDMRQDLQLLQEQVARIGDLLHRFGRIARYQEMPTPDGPQLDLDRSSGTGGAP